MRIYDIINKKKRKHELTKEEIEFFVKGVTDKSIPDYQTSALLMAIFLNGMTDEETVNLTVSMASSGDILDLQEFKDSCDKHSTGGVSDTTTLVIVPVLMSLGLTVAKMSGRGLGHTGGTIDKLESIGGFNTNLSIEQFKNVLRQCNGAVMGQTLNLCPCDGILYSLRDVTATVDSIPLIASSIMSKKLAGGAKNILLDVKFGSGAFMKTKKEANKLAALMIKIGNSAGRNTAAVLTSMEEPLTENVGCNLEFKGAIEVLNGKKNNLYLLCKELAARLLVLSGKCKFAGEGYNLFDESINSKKALQALKTMVSLQEGDSSYIDDITKFSNARHKLDIYADKSGYVKSIDAEKVGLAASVLGGGRIKKSDKIDHSAGLIYKLKIAGYVKANDLIATLYSSDASKLESARMLICESFMLDNIKQKRPKLFYEVKEG